MKTMTKPKRSIEKSTDRVWCLMLGNIILEEYMKIIMHKALLALFLPAFAAQEKDEGHNH